MARRCHGDSTPPVEGGGISPKNDKQEAIEQQGVTRGITNGERHRKEGMVCLYDSSDQC
jgi:hypothetical protein